MPKDAQAGVLGRIGPTALLLVVEGLERERGNVWLMVSGISHYKHIQGRFLRKFRPLCISYQRLF